MTRFPGAAGGQATVVVVTGGEGTVVLHDTERRRIEAAGESASIVSCCSVVEIGIFGCYLFICSFNFLCFVFD